MESPSIFKNYKTASESFWIKKQEDYCLKVFKVAATETRAYRLFLDSHEIPKNSIATYEQFSRLPFTDKKTYFRQFTLWEQSDQMTQKNPALVFTSTSGSTGSPVYFSRNEKIDDQYSVLAEFFLANGKKQKTLVMDCFGMGVWIGGLITYQAFRNAALRGWPVSLLTPGVNKKEILHALKNLAPNFECVILTGYPPFIKDIIDEAVEAGVSFSSFKTRIVCAAESFTENFRDYVCKMAKIKNPYLDTLNIYGSAELGAMAFETPGSIFIRRLALKHPKIYNKLFLSHKLPTLAQYNPEFIGFQEENGQILITGESPTPFVRYSIGDNGGTYLLSQIRQAFKEGGVDLAKEAKKAGIPLLNLPFVYVYERSDLSTTLYGLQVYPQTVKRALENKMLARFATGKFTLETQYDKKNDQYLLIHIELKKDVKNQRALNKVFQDFITRQLLEENSEYRELSKMVSKERTLPRINFWPYNDQAHFAAGIKQQWVVKK